MVIGPKANELGRHSTFAVAKFNLGGVDTKVATINISSIKLHTPEPLHPATDDDGGNRAAAATKTTTGYATITDPVSVQVLRRQRQTILMMKHSEWWFHIQGDKRSAGRSLHLQRLLGRWCGAFHPI